MIKAVVFDMFDTLVTLMDHPLYFSPQMAADCGAPEESFVARWNSLFAAGSTGQVTLEQTLEILLREHDCYSEQMLAKLVEKRKQFKQAAFDNLRPDILPMLREIKSRGIKIALISNCFSEEVPIMRSSVLFPLFDATFLSYEELVQKPDHTIFHRCLSALKLRPEECLYIGDGGSRELEAAQELGMHSLQATWFLRDDIEQPSRPNPAFTQLKKPEEILNYL